MKNTGLIIFVKNPVLGTAKTRIAVDVGDVEALDIYIKLVDITRMMAMSVDTNRYLYYSSNVDDSDEWSDDNFIKRVQHNGDLGKRMSVAFNDVLNQCDRAVIIGSDCAELTTTYINQAFKALANNDLVVGPSTDGGYYLLGMKKLHASLFEKMAWSTESVLSSTLKKAKDLNLKVFQLEPLTDIDHYSDWQAYLSKASTESSKLKR